jgi:hypothetical protein
VFHTNVNTFKRFIQYFVSKSLLLRLDIHRLDDIQTHLNIAFKPSWDRMEASFSFASIWHLHSFGCEHTQTGVSFCVVRKRYTKIWFDASMERNVLCSCISCDPKKGCYQCLGMNTSKSNIYKFMFLELT